MIDEHYLLVREAASFARLSPYRIRQLLREGRLRGVRPGGVGHWRIPTSALNRYLKDASHEARQKTRTDAPSQRVRLRRSVYTPPCRRETDGTRPSWTSRLSFVPRIVGNSACPSNPHHNRFLRQRQLTLIRHPSEGEPVLTASRSRQSADGGRGRFFIGRLMTHPEKPTGKREK